MTDSRISGLYRQTVAERIDELERLDWLSAADAEILRQGRHVLIPAAADKIIENVVGVFGLPLAIATNFIVNGRDYLVPMVVEEPSIVAAASGAAKLARASGGFEAVCDEYLLVGQVYVTGVADIDAARAALQREKAGLIDAANAIHPRLVERGGGVQDIEIRLLELPAAIAVHFLVDTCDAMGANLVNAICEAAAPRVAQLCGGDVALCILSNLADRSQVSATVHYRLSDLAVPGFSAAAVRDRIVAASDIASADPHRATTHNKGIMNGIDALAIATGNDWRAIEAGAHAFAAISGRYLPLATWSADAEGNLLGNIRLPIRVGIVGGTLSANPAAAMGLRIAGVESARELGELMAAVGLAQNFAALRALVTSGIQQGHMRLHARSAVTAGTTGSAPAASQAPLASAAGKVILLGEHAVVYGKHALVVPIAEGVSASVVASESELILTVPEWGVQQHIEDESTSIGAVVLRIMRELEIRETAFAIQLNSALPRAMGLGSSAAFAVAIIRAFNAALKLGLDDARVNSIAFLCEKIAHGAPSGVDNTIATYGTPMLFRKSDAFEFENLKLAESPPIVIACSGQSGSTKQQLAGVQSRREQNPVRYDALFDEIDVLSRAGANALVNADYTELGALMNICHGLLNAIQVSTPELESMVSIARAAGASGAKLTGAGGGGSIVALCPGKVADVARAFRLAGCRTLSLIDTQENTIG